MGTLRGLISMSLILVLASLGLISCEDTADLNTQKNTYHDDIADITYLNESFYTTNYDLSGNAGSQIDLFKFEVGDAEIYLGDVYDLDMNGQGYLALCNDGLDIYLQSRQSQLLIKSSVAGEKAYLRYDDVASNWHPCGIAYNDHIDSILALYRNSQQLDQYRLRTLDPALDGSISGDQTFSLDFVSQGYYGIYAMTYHEPHLFFLGVDSSSTDILVSTDLDLSTFQMETIPDSTVVGLTFKDDDLYLSYRDRRIEFWGSY